MDGAGVLLEGPQQEDLPVASLCGLGFLTAWQQGIKSKSQGKPCCLYGLPWEDMPFYTCHILLVRNESLRPAQMQEKRNTIPLLDVRNDNEIENMLMVPSQQRVTGSSAPQCLG